MGVAVFAGMLGVTAFGLFLTPVFYTVIGRLASRAAAAAHGAGRRDGRGGGTLTCVWQTLPDDRRAAPC